MNRIKSAKNLGRKGLSILLTVLTVLSVISVGLVPVADIVAAAADSITKTTMPTKTVYISVPETIYLAPSKTQSTDFKYFVNNSFTESAPETVTKEAVNNQSVGKFYFKCDGAKSLNVKISGVTTATSGTVTGTSAVSGNYSDGITATPKASGFVSGTVSNAGKLSAGVDNGTSSVIEWTFTYTVSGFTFTTKAYTTVYSPYIYPAFAATRAKNYRGCAADLQSMAWISGIQSSSYTEGNRSVKDDNFWPIFDKLSVPTNTQNDGGYTQDSTYYHQQATFNTGTMKNETWESKDYNDVNMEAVSPKSFLNVDVSRYSNFNQLPFFKIGFLISHNKEGSDVKERAFAYTFRDISSVYSTTAFYTHSAREDSIGSYYGKYRTSGTSIATDETYYNLSSGTGRDKCKPRLVYNNTWNRAIPSNSGDIAIMGAAYARTREKTFLNIGTGNSGASDNINVVVVNVQRVDKQALRNLINTCQNAGYQEIKYDPGSWLNYTDALKDAYKVLGNPAATKSQVESAENDLNTAKTNLKARSQGTATATYIGEHTNVPDVTLGTESKKYNYGDTVTVTPEEFTGYTLSGYTVEHNYFDLEAFYNNYVANRDASSNPLPGNNVSSVSLSSDKKTLTFVAAAGTDNYTPQPWDGNNADRNRRLYSLPVTSGRSYTLSYTATGPSAKTVGYPMDAGLFYTSGAADRQGPGAQSLTFSNIASTKKYFIFRFGNTTGGGTTTFSNIVFKDDNFTPTISNGSYITTNTKFKTLDYKFYYTPKTYTITLDKKYTPSSASELEERAGNSSVTATYDEPLPSITTPARRGYTFQGYYTGTNGSGDQWYDAQGNCVGGNWTRDSGATLYAFWKVKTYTLTVNPNGGVYEGSSSVQTWQHNFHQGVSVKNPTRVGYTFTGWDENPAIRDSHDNNSTIGYTYITANGYTGSYSYYSATEKKEGTDHYTNYKYAPSSAVSGDKWAFINFNCRASDNYGYTLHNGDKVTISGYIRVNSSQVNIQLYNGFKNNDTSDGSKHTLYLAGGSTGEWVYFTKTRTVSSEAQAEKGGYCQFVSSNMNGKSGTVLDVDLKEIRIEIDNGTGTIDTKTTIFYMPASDVTLTACWRANKYQVSFDDYGNVNHDGIVIKSHTSPTAVTATFDSPMPHVTVPTRKGYHFMGFFSTRGTSVFGQDDIIPDVSTQYYDANGNSVKNWDLDRNATLYAVWQKNEYTVSYHSNGATFCNGEMINADSAQAEATDKVLTQPRKYDDNLSLLPIKYEGQNKFLFEKKYVITFDYDSNYHDEDGHSPVYLNGTTTPAPTSFEQKARFLGWATSANGSVAKEDNWQGELIGDNENSVGFWAKWGSIPDFVLPTPSRAGAVFGGWYTTDDWEAIEARMNDEYVAYYEDNWPAFWASYWNWNDYKDEAWQAYLDAAWQEYVESDEYKDAFSAYQAANWNTYLSNAFGAHGGTMTDEAVEALKIQFRNEYDASQRSLFEADFTAENKEEFYDALNRDAEAIEQGMMEEAIREFQATFHSSVAYGNGGETRTPTGHMTLYALWDDIENPTVEFKSVTNAFDNRQTLTMNIKDNVSIAGYYWNRTGIFSDSDFVALTNEYNYDVVKTITEPGDYYIAVKDTSNLGTEFVKVTFVETVINANGGTIGRDSEKRVLTCISYTTLENVDVAVDTGNLIALPDAVKPGGYSLSGWYSAPYGGTLVSSGNNTYKPTRNATIYAGWDANVLVYDINYDDIAPNIFAPTIQSQSNNSLTVRREGEVFTFNGSANGGRPSDTLITSPFTPEIGGTYRITVYKIGGTGSGRLVFDYATEDGESAVSSTDGVRCIFDIGSADEVSSVTVSFSSSDLAWIRTLRVFAENNFWFSNFKLEIKVEKVGATEAPQVYTYLAKPLSGDAYGPLTTPDSDYRDGYYFKGWFATGDCLGDEITADTRVNSSKGLRIVYAKWISAIYYISYDGNGATEGSMESSEHYYEYAKALNENGYKKMYTVHYKSLSADVPDPEDGQVSCMFMGWSTESDGDVVYEDKEVVLNLTNVDNATIPLYAVWGDGVSDLAICTRSGYSLQGWYTNSDLRDSSRVGGGGQESVIDESLFINGEITLYAKWLEIDIKNKTVAYDFASSTAVEALDSGDHLPTDVSASNLIIGKALNNEKLFGIATSSSNIKNPENGGLQVTGNHYLAELGTTRVDGILTKSTVKYRPDGLAKPTTIYYEYQFSNGGAWQYITGSITFVPANSVYFEETAFEESDSVSPSNLGATWDVVSNRDPEWTKTTGKTDLSQVYGYSDTYANNGPAQFSMGTASLAKVSASERTSKMKEFAFNGTGFDLYGCCGPNTRTMMVYVWRTDSRGYSLVANALVDTYFADSTLYTTQFKISLPGALDPRCSTVTQMPVYHFMSSEYSEYLVQVCSVYMDESDYMTDSQELDVDVICQDIKDAGLPVDEELLEVTWVDEKSRFNPDAPDVIEPDTFLADETLSEDVLESPTYGDVINSAFLDGIRIYKPAQDESGYLPVEKNAAFFNILQFTRNGPTYTEYKTNFTKLDATPQNEIYLAPSTGSTVSGTAFALKNFKEGVNYKVMISMRAIKGTPTVTVSNGRSGSYAITLNHATEMYYDVTDIINKESNPDGTVIITNGTSGYAAICNVKIAAYTTSSDNVPAPGYNGGLMVDELMAPQALSGSEAEEVMELFGKVSSLPRFTFKPYVAPHVHTGKDDIVRYATCTEDGLKYVYCSGCHELMASMVRIPALGHSTKSSVTKRATCEEEGVKTFTCLRCSYSYTESIPAKGHKPGEWQIETNATTESEGLSVRKCLDCGKTVETKVIPALEKLIPSVSINRYEKKLPVKYYNSVIFHYTAENVPENAEVHWFIDGIDRGVGENGAYTASEINDGFTVQAKIVDKSDNKKVYDSSDETEVTVNSGFFSRLFGIIRKFLRLLSTDDRK